MREETVVLDHVWVLFQHIDPTFTSTDLVNACYFFYKNYCGFKINVLPDDIYASVLALEKEEKEIEYALEKGGKQ